jgi:hypothetical protein
MPKSEYGRYSYSDIFTRPEPNQLSFLYYRMTYYDLKKMGICVMWIIIFKGMKRMIGSRFMAKKILLFDF